MYQKEYIERIQLYRTYTYTHPQPTSKMGIDILCNGESYSCGYVAWALFREEIANASIRYLNKIYDDMLNRTVESTTEQLAEQTLIEKILEYVNSMNCITTEDFVYFFKDIDFQNTFIYFELGGVYALLNKGDGDGFYTVGNSLDIVDTMELVEPYIMYDDVKSRYNSVKKVFNESVMARRVVIIC